MWKFKEFFYKDDPYIDQKELEKAVSEFLSKHKIVHITDETHTYCYYSRRIAIWYLEE